ncbi:MAG: hypothetical protein IPH10_11060 [bacterium]|nr:hypothetical protein [bacterium]
MGRVNWMEEHKNWILPSNMTRDEYDAWPTTDYRGKLGTIITVLHSPEAFWLGQIPGLYDERKATVRKALAPVQELLDQTPMPGGGEVTLDIEICGMSRTLWNLLGPKQRQWVAANCYVNVGFYPVDIVHDVSIAQPIGATLTLYDFLCERHSSEHALDHEPVELSRRKVNQLSLDTNIPVQNDMLFLPNRLMEFRKQGRCHVSCCPYWVKSGSSISSLLGRVSYKFPEVRTITFCRTTGNLRHGLVDDHK